MAPPQDRWSSRVGFVLATIASAVGLGSIWKFPYELGANGGGAFLLVYVLGLLLVVAPLMLAEMAIGRRGQVDAALSMSRLAAASGASRLWGAVGGLGVIASSLILSYYSVIGGWAIAHAVEAATDGLAAGGSTAVQARFGAFLGSTGRMLGYHTLFMSVIALIVARGVAGGIEVAAKFLMPVMVLLIAVLCIYSLVAGDAVAALRFLFVPDFDRLSPLLVLNALGLGFFSIGVGYATLMTYTAYADRRIDLRQAALSILVGDTTISLLSGLAVFPLVFAHRLAPDSGPGLVFVTLPLAFADMPFGREAAVAFFSCLSIAAIASAISMLEMPVAFLRRRFGWSRLAATVLAAGVCWVAGLASVLSFGPWSGWQPLAALGLFTNASLFDLIDGFSSNVLLPAAGLGISLFAGWVLPWRTLAEELGLRSGMARGLRFLMRHAVPALIVLAALEPALRSL